jgi:type IV pilus assembly protein PilC
MADKLKQRRERLAQVAQTGPVAGGFERAARRGRRRRVSRVAKTVFTAQLATLQDAGLPVLRSLRILENQLREGPLKEIVAGVAEDVEGGASLSDALAKHPGVFDDLYVNLVKAGEASGSLTTICNRLAEFMEKTDRLIRRVKGALTYPLIVMTAAVLIVLFIMLVIIPQFESVFDQLDIDLPGPTRKLMAISRWGVANWYILLLVPLAVWGALALTDRNPKGRRFLHRLKLHLPGVGPIFLKSQVARFARTLGTLSSSGVPIMQALDICSQSAGNVVFAEGVAAVKAAVAEGEPMARPLAETDLVDDIVVNMVDVGEETGELDRMLLKVADNHEAEVDRRIGALVAALEPALILAMAVIVGFIVISLFLPLIQLQESLASR